MHSTFLIYVLAAATACSQWQIKRWETGTIHSKEWRASESRIFWSRIGGNCDHYQNIFWKRSKYIDIKFEYGIFTHQINDHNYFNIFTFFNLFLNICVIIYKLYCAIFSQHFFSIIICIKISDVISTIKFMVIVFSLWNASEHILTVLIVNFIMIVFTCWKVS
jgi:hypothetical protein